MDVKFTVEITGVVKQTIYTPLDDLKLDVKDLTLKSTQVPFITIPVRRGVKKVDITSRRRGGWKRKMGRENLSFAH
jgi:hypothetical protein